MYTSILLVALTGMAPSAEGSKTPAWGHDYTSAGKQAAQEKKPLPHVVDVLAALELPTLAAVPWFGGDQRTDRQLEVRTGT